MRLTMDDYVARGKHLAEPTSLADAYELGLADAACGWVWSNSNPQFSDADDDQVNRFLMEAGLSNLHDVLARRLVHELPLSVEITPKAIAVMLESIHPSDTEERHLACDLVMCAISKRAGYDEFVARFLGMYKWYS